MGPGGERWQNIVDVEGLCLGRKNFGKTFGAGEVLGSTLPGPAAPYLSVPPIMLERRYEGASPGKPDLTFCEPSMPSQLPSGITYTLGGCKS